MKTLLLLAAAVLALTAVPASADLYAELSLESGGDVIIPTNTRDSIDAGGGLKLAIGIQNPINNAHTGALRLSVGYLFDRIDADNGDAEFDTLTFDAMYVVNSGPHRLGVGATLHLSPEYHEDLIGMPPFHIDFDDAVGVVMHYGYQLTPGFELGVKLTSIDYRSNINDYDASSIGVYFSNGF